MDSVKKLYLAGIVIPWVFIAIAYYYFQLHLDLIPCPLCMFQRAALAGISIVCFLGLLYSPTLLLKKVYDVFIALFSLIGLGIAGRQVWLQHLPADKVPQCGFDPVYRWMQSESGGYNFWQMVGTTLKGSGDCAEVDWSLLGVSMAGWMVLVFFVSFAFTVNHFRLLK